MMAAAGFQPAGGQTPGQTPGSARVPLDPLGERSSPPVAVPFAAAAISGTWTISYCLATPRRSWLKCDARWKTSSKDSACLCTSARAACIVARTESSFSGGGCFRKNRGWCGTTWSDSAGGCGTWSGRFEKALLRLLVHERKSRVYRCADGVVFLGWRLFPEKSRLVRDNVVRFRRRFFRKQ